jgi:hypothetical protein
VQKRCKCLKTKDLQPASPSDANANLTPLV